MSYGSFVFWLCLCLSYALAACLLCLYFLFISLAFADSNSCKGTHNKEETGGGNRTNSSNFVLQLHAPSMQVSKTKCRQNRKEQPPPLRPRSSNSNSTRNLKRARTRLGEKTSRNSNWVRRETLRELQQEGRRLES